MKFCITLFLSIIISSTAISQQVYVYSFSFLNLRDSTSTTSNVLTQLHFGDTVQVIETTNIDCPIANVFVNDTLKRVDSIFEENPIMQDLNLQGKWVKVQYKTLIGFVNGVYLSSLPHLQNLKKKFDGKLTSDKIEQTALNDETFFLLNCHYKIPKKSPLLKPAALFYKKIIRKKDEQVDISYKIKYTDGLQYNYEDSYLDTGSGGYTITITKKGLKFEEAIMFARAFFYDFEKTSGNKFGFYITDENRFMITRNGEGGGCDAEVFKNKNGEWVITFGCGGC